MSSLQGILYANNRLGLHVYNSRPLDLSFEGFFLLTFICCITASRPFVNIPSEHFRSQESGTPRPQPHQLKGGRGVSMTNHTTFDLRNFQERSQRRDQGALCGESSDMDVEHEAVPEPCLSERGKLSILYLRMLHLNTSQILQLLPH